MYGFEKKLRSQKLILGFKTNGIKVIDDFKFLLKDIVVIFLPDEVKEAYGVLYEIDREIKEYGILSNVSFVWPTVRTRIEKYLVLQTRLFLSSVREKNLSPRDIIYNITYNISAGEVEAADGYSSSINGYEILN